VVPKNWAVFDQWHTVQKGESRDGKTSNFQTGIQGPHCPPGFDWEEQINCRVDRRAIQTTGSKHAFPRYPNLVADLKITRPDQVWVSDIT
jgi:hypothetical protein